MKENVVLNQDPIEIVYEQSRFELLSRLREEAWEIQRRVRAPTFVYGSLARGDVHNKSDIDIIILEPVDALLIEYELGVGEGAPVEREIVQATPNHVVKGHIHINHYTTLTFPLLPLNPVEEEFYRYSGLCGNEEGGRDRRVPGVNKKLLLIQPTERGHIESSIMDRTKELSKLLDVRMDIIQERIRVLTKRTKYGRTGVFLQEPLQPNETFGSKLQYLADRNNIVRRQIRLRGG